MPLIRNGVLEENTWTHAPDGEVDTTVSSVTVSLETFLSKSQSLKERNTPIGVRLQPEDDPATLEPHLSGLSLIEILFPKYTDGRGYSQAQLLRRRYGYDGELRAVGHVLRDQILYMNRSGFDAFETARADLHDILDALAEHSAFYQQAADRRHPVFRARHGS